MSCNHPNPSGYLFCGSCGEALDPTLCRCGFVTAKGDVFCGRCGNSLMTDTAQGLKGAADNDQRFDLEYLVQQASQESKFFESTHKARVTQDDIRKLLATRRKKF
ncbi:MAG: zinc ribbon domain-containing protein [Gallionella sp.]|nr:zinc ribbon domain-containing protein [Gallionella sp.]MDD4963809.1 zinc ribbon domain-containing protein [Gallionella sp.]